MAELAAATAAASKAAEKVTETVCEFGCQQVNYVFKYQSYMKKLKERVKELRSRREDVEEDVKVAERQGEEIYNEVTEWLKGVEEFVERVAKLVDDEDKTKMRCFKGLCPHLIKRFRLSKEAEKVAEDGADLLEQGKFSRVSHPHFLQRTESIFLDEGYEHFLSRESNFQDIMDTLKDSSVNMIGVYGMGGVGKTTLVKKVAWKAKEDKLFDEVVIAEVTETPDLKQIQADIAGQLGMVFKDQESLYGRAEQLRYRLKKYKKILVIVDNIWEKLNLKVVGIPICRDEKLQCTILLTARTLVVLNQMKTQKNISVEPLASDDARNLFGSIVGNLSEKGHIAAELVEKCAGLPLAVTTIANALKGKSDSVWKDALLQLKSYNPICVPEMDNTLYSTIELSYRLLNSEEAKLLLLLCALFNDRHVSFFLFSAMGLGLFENVHTINDARNRLKSLIDYLQASCLLLKSNNNERVKMHDVVHTVVLSIAKEKCIFDIPDVEGIKEVLMKRMYRHSIAMSLFYRHTDGDGLPERVEFPQLNLFTLCIEEELSLQIPEHFFEGMKELKVLELGGVQLLPPPPSFGCLANLKRLYLRDCYLGDITMIGELRKLETLTFISCDFEKLPESFKQLTELKLLQLSHCPKLKVIPPNVIASLSRLEELYIYNSFDRWEVEGQNNASLAELKELSQLNTLCIHILTVQIIQQDFIPVNLEKYKVHIGDVWDWSYEYETSRTLRLKFNGSLHVRYGIEILMEKAKYLYLDQLDGVKDMLWELDREGFPGLKHLSVQNSSEILSIVNSMECIHSNDAFPILESMFLINLSNMEQICCGLDSAKSFSQLRIIEVAKCDKLRYLFSSSMAKNLLLLEKIDVTNCEMLKEIFGEESKDHVDENKKDCKIEFKQLHSLVLQGLPQFISFGLEVVLTRLENLKLSSINTENIWVNLFQPMSSYIRCLKSLTVEECNSLKFLFSSSVVKSLVQLQKLVICNCKSMEAVIFDSEGLEGADKIIEMTFPKLFCLKLQGLPKLTRFGIGNSLQFPTLNELHIESCSSLRTFFPNSSSVDALRIESGEESLENILTTNIEPLFDNKVDLPGLEKLTLLHLDNLQLMWHIQLCEDSFCKLKEVRVQFCKKLMTIVPSDSTQGLLTFQNLETLTVENCWNLKSLFPISIATSLLQLKKLRLVCCGLGEIVAKGEVAGAPIFLFPQLSYLKLNNLPQLKHFYLGSYTTEWSMLKQLEVFDCNKIKLYAFNGESQPALFSFEKVIPNLEILGLNADNVTSSCLDPIPARSFGKLKFLGLDSFDDYSVGFQFGLLQKTHNLEALCLYDCTFQELLPYKGYSRKQNSNMETFLQNLQTLEVWRCHRLTYLMSSSVICLKNIKSLKVYRCNGLKNILSCSAATALVHLTTISVKECESVRMVVATEVSTTEEEIVFSQLKKLKLQCLKNLTCFCSANYAFQFPCLEHVIVSQCPSMKTFSQGGLSTQKLDKVQLTKKIKTESFWKDDLNSTIQHMFTNMVGFSNIEDLKLSEFPELKEKIWQSEVPDDLFYNLKSLVLDAFLESSSAIPSHVLSGLKNLETLEVRNCDSLKQMFDTERTLNVDGHTSKRSHQDVLNLKNLKSLKVHKCNGLRYIFTPSVILSLAQLQDIEVNNCALIEEIIRKEGENDAEIDKIYIPQLNSISLEALPNLARFCSGIRSLACPSLKSIRVARCPKIETFVFADMKHQSERIAPFFCEKVAFPNLEEMQLVRLGNLNLIWHNQLDGDSFCKLKEVRVEFCENLVTMVPSDSTQGVLAFHNLETLIVENCWNIKCLFPVSIATSLLQLKKLMLFSCGLEEIVAKGEVGGAPIFLFPQLTWLRLNNLPKLKHFYLGSYTAEWSMLKQLEVYDCNKIKIYALDGESQPTLFSFEKVIPNLETLGLNADNVTSSCLDPIPAKSFGKLKFLGLDSFDDYSVGFQFGLLQKLHNLETLGLYDCTFQELLPYEGYARKQNFRMETFLQNLQTLKVWRCHCLTYLMSSSVICFKNIKNLNVYSCNRLKYILSCSAATALVHLTTISVSECESLRMVVATEINTTEEEVVFSQLRKLKFHCLKSLTCFCSANYAFRFPCLEQVIVSQCPNMKTFSQGSLSTQKLDKVQLTKKIKAESFWKDDLNSTIQHMFTNMVGFRNIEDLKLSEFSELKEKIWKSEVLDDLFYNLKSLVLDAFLESSSAIPSHVLSGFENLETLEVRNCDSLKQLFDTERTLNVDGHTSKRSHQDFLNLKNLKSLKVHKCNGLRYIFTPAIILGLAQLQDIEVKNCALIDEIIRKGENDAEIDKIYIPQLNSISLESLPNLARFCSGIRSLACPSLKSIRVARCPKIETFVFADMKHQSEHIAPLFCEKVAFPNLEEMQLVHLGNLQLIWHNQLYGDSFCKLKEVRVEFCENLVTIVPSDSTQELLTFQNLETLTVENCWNIKNLFPVSIATSLLQIKKLTLFSCGLGEIVAGQEVDEAPRSLFPQLTMLKLDNLPELKHFYLGLHTAEWPMLKELYVYDCNKIKVYTLYGESPPALFSFEKVIPNLESLGLNADNVKSICMNRNLAGSFGNLKFLRVVGIDEDSLAFQFGLLQKLYNLEALDLYNCTFQELLPYERYARKQDSQVETFFQNLQTLRVWSCHCLTYLMPSSYICFKNIKHLEVYSCNGLAKILACSVVRTLVQITTIKIRECELVTEVIATEIESMEDEIVFSQLKTLELHCLKSLVCFCSANYTFQFPCLEQVIVSQCPNFKIFSHGGLSTPKLKKVQLTENIDVEYLWKGDLNSTIQHVWDLCVLNF
ncbi:uncharacterized protein LOC123202630 [Mangifera indica]|uniref:uncharacterized protein LOC123202630 n=1 Tax=Mangifera indica TaxID=29780 RepID=UPI001CF95ED2|nr:uncharacterized protein LOC123202630 [Mangifera indica]